MSGDWLTRLALYAGVAAPFLYYGNQAVASLFFPGFSITGITASELGSEVSKHPSVFNAGAILQGIVGVFSSLGFLRAYRRLGWRILAWPTCLAVALTGMGSLWAGIYPLPDPRHAGSPAFLVAMLALPVLFAVTLWRGSHPALKAYLAATLLLLSAMFPIMAGMTGLDTQSYRGLYQRIFALTVFPPIAVSAWVLARRIRDAEEGERSAENAPAVAVPVGE